MPDDAVREQLAAWRDAWDWPRSASLVKTGRLHITLHFLGDVDQDRIPALTAALAVPFTPFSLSLRHAVVWPHGIAVLEPESIPAPLAALHAALADVLGDQGLPVDTRPFRPHVTLARRAKSSTPPAADREIDWKIEGYALMSSTLGRDGGYAVLERYTDLNG